MADELPAYRLDIAGLEPPDHTEQGGQRPWVGIRFECCGLYARVYRTRDGTVYRGRCPRCLRQVRLRVGPDGINERFFRAR
jgi:hypothetical protein